MNINYTSKETSRLLQNGTKAMPALLMRMCSGRFFSLNDLTKSLVDWKEARSSFRNSTFSSFSDPTLSFIRAIACTQNQDQLQYAAVVQMVQ